MTKKNEKMTKCTIVVNGFFLLSSIGQTAITTYKGDNVIALFKHMHIVIVFVQSPRGFGRYIDRNTVIVAFDIDSRSIQIYGRIVRREFQFYLL